ncbi:MAG TPA: CheR family methyltransferase, partial [Terriglobales bacterium]|nr:CheR family methyltransferase [Terriglobales bacterium]
GLDLRGYKRTTLARRIARRMTQVKLDDYQRYLEFIRKRPEEINQLLTTILINVTRFFRDPPAWDVLRKQVLPRLASHRGKPDSFRVWCAGCATGEEAYSVAILLAEHFGNELREHDVKIYATDQDEAALTTARHAEYPAEKVASIPASWRQKYFRGDDNTVRVERAIRKMVIFGRSNLLEDAPISHVRLLVCRNVLIYFDTAAQQQILKRLEYALDPGGVLFLGSTESQLRRNNTFAPLNAKWRIFQRTGQSVAEPPHRRYEEETLRGLAGNELAVLRAYHESLLDSLEPGILIMDMRDAIISENASVARLWGTKEKLAGRLLPQSELARRCPELPKYLERSRAGPKPETVRFEFAPARDKLLSVTVKPILSQDQAGQVGTLLYTEDVTSRETMQGTVDQLQSTTEELQSANEELETANEELQSTNEELETTNEELQSLNEELETTNEEMAERSRQLDIVSERYFAMLELIPSPVLLVDKNHRVYVYNSAAKKLLGFAAPSSEGIELNELPIGAASVKLLARSYGEVAAGKRPVTLRNRRLETNRGVLMTNIHITPLSKSNLEHGVMLLFELPPDPRALPGRKSQPGHSFQDANRSLTNPPLPERARGNRNRKDGRAR